MVRYSPCYWRGSVVTSLLTLYVVARVWTKAFWRARVDAPKATSPTPRRRVLLDGLLR